MLQATHASAVQTPREIIIAFPAAMRDSLRMKSLRNTLSNISDP
jgi:hypothetical protein